MGLFGWRKDKTPVLNQVQERIIRAQLSDESLAVRLNTLDELTSFGVSASLLEPLGDLLADPDPEIVEKAAQAIERHGKDARSLAPRLFSALKQTDSIAFVAVSDALSGTGFSPADAVPAINKALQDKDESHLCRILGMIPQNKESQREILQPLLDILQASGSIAVKCEAAKLLSGFGKAASAGLPALASAAASVTHEVLEEHREGMALIARLRDLQNRQKQGEDIYEELEELGESEFGFSENQGSITIRKGKIHYFRPIVKAIKVISPSFYETAPELSEVRVVAALLEDSIRKNAHLSKDVSIVDMEKEADQMLARTARMSNSQFIKMVQRRAGTAESFKKAVRTRVFSADSEVREITRMIRGQTTHGTGLLLATRIKPPRQELLPDLIEALREGWLADRCLAVRALENLGPLAAPDAIEPLERLAGEADEIAGPLIFRALRRIRSVY